MSSLLSMSACTLCSELSSCALSWWKASKAAPGAGAVPRGGGGTPPCIMEEVLVFEALDVLLAGEELVEEPPPKAALLCRSPLPLGGRLL